MTDEPDLTDIGIIAMKRNDEIRRIQTVSKEAAELGEKFEKLKKANLRSIHITFSYFDLAGSHNELAFNFMADESREIFRDIVLKKTAGKLATIMEDVDSLVEELKKT